MRILLKTFIFLFIFGAGAIFMPFFESIQAEEPYLIQSPEGKEVDLNLTLIQDNTIISVTSHIHPELEKVRRIDVIITAYSSTPSQTWGNPFITASNTRVRKGIVANNLLPFGTKIEIPELYKNQIFTVEDRMHSRKSIYHVDIWFPSYEEAKNFGTKRTYIEVL